MLTDDNPIRIGVLGATFETPNMGVGALAAGAIKCVLAVYPQAAVFFLDYGTEGTVRTVLIEGRSVSVPLVNMRFSKKFYLSNNIAVLLLAAILLKLIPFMRVRRWLVKGNACLRAISQADLFASVAGGDSFSDIYGFGRFLYSALPQILVILLGKRLILLPQTYGPFRSRVSRSLARHIIARAERSYCRDYRSLNELTGVVKGREQKGLGFCYDMAFGLDAVAPSALSVTGLSLDKKDPSPLVGLNASGLLLMGGYTRKNAFGLRAGYEDLIHALICFLISTKGATVLLVPHVFGGEAGSESDVLACERVFADLGPRFPDRLGVVRGSYDQSEIKHIIGLCDFFVGSRMHACIAAVSQHIPAVSVAYSDKFLGVMETIGVESLTADARKLGQEEILQLVGQAYENRRLIAAELAARMPRVKESVLRLFNGVLPQPENVAALDQQEALQVGTR